MEDGERLCGRFGTFRKPDAVIAGSDEVAAGMVMEALKNGVKNTTGYCDYGSR